jgi:hypothetical protein
MVSRTRDIEGNRYTLRDRLGYGYWVVTRHDLSTGATEERQIHALRRPLAEVMTKIKVRFDEGRPYTGPATGDV